MSAIFYGLGLGPGDPELITLKSWRILSMAEAVAWPVGPSGASRARETAAPFIPEDVIALPLPIPFGGAPAALARAYDEAAAVIAEHLEAGRDVAFICMGDPLFHGSFIYLAQRLEGAHEVRAVPGVAAPMACTAALGRPLARGKGIVKILPATADATRLRAELANGPATLAFIKAGHHAAALRGMIEEAGLLDHAIAIENAGMDDERIIPLAEAGADMPYFSTIMVFAGDET